MSVNKAIIIGNLGQDPEVRYLNSGDAVATISVATSESWKDKTTGEKQQKTEWHRVVFFKRQAEIVGEYLHKGSKVYICGKLQTKKWQDKSGVDRYTTEIIGNELQMLDGKQSDNNSSQTKSNDYAKQSGARDSGSDNFDDDIPF